MISLKQLHEQYPEFVYDGFETSINNNNLKIIYSFFLGENKFKHKLVIKNLPKKFNKTDLEFLRELIFHLGLVEALSYWKLTISSKFIIKAGVLDNQQILWFKKLIKNGLGEFFYRNRKIIEADQNYLKKFLANDYLEIINQPHPHSTYPGGVCSPLDHEAVLIPIGGGKDSLVTLEILKQTQKKIFLFSWNPTGATQNIFKLNPNVPQLIINRELDPQLFYLNSQNFLNGHVPISASMAFMSQILAQIFGIKTILLSNESSASESNLNYWDREINHQYSKSFEFEQDFREFNASCQAEYLSFLRPLNELQIAKIFSKLDQKYFSVFRSCNKGQKTNIWCHACSKCLFAFLVLFNFIDEKTLTTKIFSSNLFEDKNLIDEAKKLIHPDKTKPWDCVGTRAESQVAFYLAIKKYEEANRELPIVLKTIQPELAQVDQNLVEKILNNWDENNFLNSDLANLLKKNL